MGNLYKGKIKEINDYYGIIIFEEVRNINNDETLIIERKIPFFIKDKSEYTIGDELDFEISNQSSYEDKNAKVRSREIQYAINIKKLNCNNEKKELENKQQQIINLLNSKILSNSTIEDETSLQLFFKENNLRYSKINDLLVILELVDKKISVDELKMVLNYDTDFKAMILKWILASEQELKDRLEQVLHQENIHINEILDKIDNSNENSLKKLKKNTLKRIKKNYLFRAGDWRLNFIVEDENSMPKLKYAPLDMILDEFTIGDLLQFIKFIESEFSEINNSTTNWSEILDYLSEVKYIRNISAHGNSFLSSILDTKNNPNYLLEENSSPIGDDAFYIDSSKKYNIFHIVRSPIKLMTKGYVRSPQVFALELTKKVLNNQTYRSFVYFYYLVHLLFNDTYRIKSFNNDLNQLFFISPKTVNFDKILLNMDSRYFMEDREKLNKNICEEAIEMFMYVKDNNLESTEPSETTYKVVYRGENIIIDLSENANWPMEVILQMADKYPNKSELYHSNEMKEFKKFEIFFVSHLSYREGLIGMLEQNLEVDENKEIRLLMNRIDGFEMLQFLFIDVLKLGAYTLT